jgi:hypothetical protein
MTHIRRAYALPTRWRQHGVKKPLAVDRGFPLSEYSAYLWAKKRADERTRTAYPCSLRVIGQVLHGFAQACKSRIVKPFSFLWFAPCCTVLRSRWYQSGIKRLPLMHLRSLSPTGALSMRSASSECERTPHPWIATFTGYRAWADVLPKRWTKCWARRSTLALCFSSVVARVAATAKRGLVAWSPSPRLQGPHSARRGLSRL